MDANSTNETACATADANNDGILDLFVGAHGSGEVSLLLGDGEGGFTFSSKVAAGGNGSWMIAVGDVNQDGYADAAIVNSQSSNVGIILGDGAGGLSAAVTYPTGGFPIAIDLGDIDGDEDLDLMTSNYSGGNWTYWENDGSGTFINRRTLESETAGSCATFHDRDNDGDLDMTGIDEIDDLIIMFENTGTSAVTEHSPRSIQLFRDARPNPFSENTTLVFIVPAGVHARAMLRIIDASGHQVFEFLSDNPQQGEQTVTFDATTLPSGKYICILDIGGFHDVIELVHVR
jgi:hypothetical protein